MPYVLAAQAALEVVTVSASLIAAAVILLITAESAVGVVVRVVKKMKG